MKSTYSNIVQKTKMLKESVANVLGIKNNTYNEDIRVLEDSKIASAIAIDEDIQNVKSELDGIKTQLNNIYTLLAGESATANALTSMNTHIEEFTTEAANINQSLQEINNTLSNLNVINTTLENSNTIDEEIKTIMGNWIWNNNNVGGE